MSRLLLLTGAVFSFLSCPLNDAFAGHEGRDVGLKSPRFPLGLERDSPLFSAPLREDALSELTDEFGAASLGEISTGRSSRMSGVLSPHCFSASPMDPVVTRVRALLEVVEATTSETHDRSNALRELHERIFEKLVLALKLSSSIFSDLPDLSIYQLVTEVEKAKESGKKLPYMLSVPGRGDQLVKVIVKKDAGELLLVRNQLGEGASKVVRRVVVYDRMVGAALLRLHKDLDDEDAQAEFQRELEVSSQIMALPEPRRVGLVKTLHLGSKAMIQEIYDQNAFRFFQIDRSRGSSSIAPTDQLRLLSEVSSGLSELHGLGWVHSDIKPENMLVRDNDGHLELALSDFGLSYAPKEVIASGSQRPCGGSLAYLSPQDLKDCARRRVRRNWPEGEIAQKTEQVQKQDVFALATSAYEILHQKSAPWGSGCASRTIEQTLACAERAIAAYQKSASESDVYDPVRLLLSRAIEPREEDRLSSQLFAQGMMHLARRSSETFHGVASASLELSLRSLRVTKDEAETRLREIAATESKSSGLPPVLFSIESLTEGGSQYGLRVHYFDRSGRYVSQVMRDVPGHHSEAVKQEVRFLQEQGIASWPHS